MSLLEQFRDFLVTFHERYPGDTAELLSNVRTSDGRTSYQALADMVIESATRAPRIVDMGCGDGVLLQEIAIRCSDARLTGIDIAASDIALAKKRVPQAAFIVGDFTSYPLGASAYDAIVSHLAFMLSGPLEPVFASVSNALASGGTLSFVVDDLSVGSTYYADLIDVALDAAGVQSATTPFGPIVDRRLYDQEQLRALLEAHSLVLEQYSPHELRGALTFSELWEMLRRLYQIGTLTPAGQEAAKAALCAYVEKRPCELLLPFRLVVARRTR